MKSWKCSVCGYHHPAELPPMVCPVCHAPEDDFSLVEPPETSTPDM